MYRHQASCFFKDGGMAQTLTVRPFVTLLQLIERKMLIWGFEVVRAGIVEQVGRWYIHCSSGSDVNRKGLFTSIILWPSFGKQKTYP